jgi:magnesium chelatase family protein
MTAAQLQHCCALPRASEKLLQQSAERLALSDRGINRLPALGRTIADLAGIETIEPAHLAEAVQLRPPLKSSYCANDTM